jgi:protein phosphatase
MPDDHSMGTPPSPESEQQAAEANGGGPRLQVSIASLSDVGRVRSENQDGCGVFRDSHGNHLLVVADGMGGHRGGATASRVCVETVGRVFQWSPDPVPERLQRGLLEANRSIHTMAAEDSSLAGMGTTAVALALGADGEGWVAWAGDSRLYRLRDGKIEPLTEDHSLVAEWVRLGVLRPEDAATHPRRNELMRCVGPAPTLDSDVERIEIRPGDRFLLCSDGLWGEVSDAEIGAVLGAETPEHAVRRLVDLANERGGPDNVTVQIAEAGGAPPRRAAAAATPAAPVERSRAVPLAAGVALAAVLLAALLWVAVMRGVGESDAELAAVPEEVAEPSEEPEEAADEGILVEEGEAQGEEAPLELEAEPEEPEPAELELPAESPAPPAPPSPDEPRATASAQPAPEPEAARALTPPPGNEPTPPKTAPAPGAPLPPRPEFRDVPPEEAAAHAAPAPSPSPPSSPQTQVASATPSPAGAGSATALARIEAFLAEWALSVEKLDFPRYHALGLPLSRERFEESYAQRKERSLRFAVLEHKRVDPALLHVRVSMTYSYRTSTGPAKHSGEQTLVLREADGELRYAGRLP